MTDRISPDGLLRLVEDGGEGAVVLFGGRVRGRNEGRAVRVLHYEAYEAMAADILAAIGAEAIERCGATQVAVRHRAGDVHPGEWSLLVAVAAPRRAAGFAAARYVVEQVKGRLPVWKREVYEDGTSRWLDGVDPGVRSADEVPMRTYDEGGA
ncbi:MAG: molybdenum cofactor biosynthesis protein MoaE [Gemmatimonadota bacterium]|nr:molybdenum cofactor biosynthesis protein MoaE [Gemmatimonadota bacterium]